MVLMERPSFELLRLKCVRYMLLEAGCLFFIIDPEFKEGEISRQIPQVAITKYNDQYVVFLPFDEVCPMKQLKDESHRLLNLQRSGMFQNHFHKWVKQFASPGLKRTLSLEKKVKFVTAQ